MTNKQKIRVLGLIFLILGTILYFIDFTIFALIMVAGGVVTFIFADQAEKKENDKFLDEDFKYSR